MVYETFSKRNQRIANEGKTEIYQYDNLPHPFRVQVVHIWHDALGKYYLARGYSSGHPYASNAFWDEIHDTLAREAGLPHLGRVDQEANQRCIDYVLHAPTAEALDIIELSFTVIDRVVRQNFRGLPPRMPCSSEFRRCDC
jgi:hypothetical protein